METEGKSGHKPRRKFGKIMMRLVVTAVLIAAAGLCVVLFLKYREAVDTNPKTIEQRTIDAVAQIAAVPEERPAVITVQDAAKLSNPELVARAENGDHLLVYAENRRVVIYRPSNGKIIDILTIKNDDTTVVNPAGQPEGATLPEATVESEVAD